MNFDVFKNAVAKQFANMVANDSHLFVTETTKDDIWDTYINSFPEGTNPVFRERTEHDCCACKHFIRAIGNVVAIDTNNKLVSIWDVKLSEEESAYQTVADALSKYVKSKKIRNVFLTDQRTAGLDKNVEDMGNGEVHTWTHFFVNVPNKFVVRNDRGSKLSETLATFSVLHRGLTELTDDAFESVIDLIAQNSLYRGQEFSNTVNSFYSMKKSFVKAKNKWNAAWLLSVTQPISVTRLRNTAIGTLLVDLSDGMDLDQAVNAFESKVSAGSYKRPNAVYTEKMKQEAAKKVEELGLTSALSRRRAVMSDIGVNNVLFVDRDVKPKMADSPFDAIADSTASKKISKKKLDKVEEVSIEKFVNDILPSATGLELYLENKHEKNLMTLAAPVDPTAGNLFKWNNNFSWAYNGGVADSVIKQRVKAAGGNVDAAICFRLAWFNYDDLDLHLIEPTGTEIYYGNHKGHKTTLGGMLDVDMNAGGGSSGDGSRTPVENIFYEDTSKMKSGRYKLFVHQYRSVEKVDFGFEVEVQINGDTISYSYDKPMRTGEKIVVLEFYYDANTGEMKDVSSLNGSSVSKNIWGLETNKYHKVTMAMLSPNYWDGQGIGNKHYMFMLNNCSNPEPSRGFFNEFLRADLNEHRKVFEALGSKMLTQPAADELSGIAFSSTQRADVLCRVSGSFNRVVKIVF